MDPFTAALVNLGGGFALAAAVLMLHREALKAFREEMATERARNDANLTTFWAKLDGLRESVDEAKCRASVQQPSYFGPRRPPEAPG